MLRPPNVVLLCTDELHSAGLRDILSKHAIVTLARNLPELKSVLEDGGCDALICAWSFHRGTWIHALRAVQRLNPDLPVIIFSSSGGEQEWAEVLEAGAFDLLVPPYHDRAVLSTLEHAIASHEARILHRK